MYSVFICICFTQRTNFIGIGVVHETERNTTSQLGLVILNLMCAEIKEEEGEEAQEARGTTRTRGLIAGTSLTMDAILLDYKSHPSDRGYPHGRTPFERFIYIFNATSKSKKSHHSVSIFHEYKTIMEYQ